MFDLSLSVDLFLRKVVGTAGGCESVTVKIIGPKYWIDSKIDDLPTVKAPQPSLRRC